MKIGADIPDTICLSRIAPSVDEWWIVRGTFCDNYADVVLCCRQSASATTCSHQSLSAYGCLNHRLCGVIVCWPWRNFNCMFRPNPGRSAFCACCIIWDEDSPIQIILFKSPPVHFSPSCRTSSGVRIVSKKWLQRSFGFRPNDALKSSRNCSLRDCASVVNLRKL